MAVASNAHETDPYGQGQNPPPGYTRDAWTMKDGRTDICLQCGAHVAHYYTEEHNQHHKNMLDAILLIEETANRTQHLAMQYIQEI